MRELPNLDFLRACAVLSVVMEHALLAFGVQYLGPIQVAWIGVVGVFLFFVHTSLVLMWSLERKPHTLDFYIRRIFRIYPLAIVFLSAALLLHAPLNGTPQHFFLYQPPPDRASVLYAVALMQNLGNGYTPLGVLWSLCYEVQMYVLLPALFFFVARNFSRWPLLLIWTLCVLLSRPLFQGQAHNIFLCIPYFLPGVIAYVGFARDKARLPAWTFPVALLLLWSAFLIAPTWRRADLLCLAAGLMLPLFHQIKARWLIRGSHTIAKYSYGAYVAHPFALLLGIYLLPHRPLALQLTVIVCSLLVLAVASYHLIERPLIRMGSRLAASAERRHEQQQLAFHRVPEAEIT